MTGQSLYYPRVMMRTLAQVLTEEYSEHGVHVANVVIDGLIGSPGTHALPRAREQPQSGDEPGEDRRGVLLSSHPGPLVLDARSATDAVLDQTELLMPTRAASLGVAMVLALCATAEAALPPYVFEMWGKEATAHLQAEILSMTPGLAQRTECDTVLGVRRLFRDASGTLRTDSKIRLLIPCSRPPRSSSRKASRCRARTSGFPRRLCAPENSSNSLFPAAATSGRCGRGGLADPIDGPSETPTR